MRPGPSPIPTKDVEMNRAEIVGRLVRDPTLRAVNSGAFLAEFQVAVEEVYRGEIRTAFIGCVAWEAVAERIGEQCKKGDELYVLGRLEQREIEKPGGGKESKTRLRVIVATLTQPARTNQTAGF